MPKIWEKFVFKESHAIMQLMRGFGSMNINFQGFSLDKEVPKSIFGQRQPRPPHNLGLLAG